MLKAERDVMLVKKLTYFGEFGHLKYYFNVFKFNKRKIHAFVAKLSDRCFCWFPVAMPELIRMGSNMASPYKSL